MRQTGFARVLQDDGGVYFRIESVPRHQFSNLLDLFLARFPTRVWNEQKRAWQLPHHQRDALIKFARATFGKSRVIVDLVPTQTSLPF